MTSARARRAVSLSWVIVPVVSRQQGTKNPAERAFEQDGTAREIDATHAHAVRTRLRLVRHGPELQIGVPGLTISRQSQSKSTPSRGSGLPSAAQPLLRHGGGSPTVRRPPVGSSTFMSGLEPFQEV